MSGPRIERFSEDYAFLSNFAPVPGGVVYEGVRYSTLEHAFQAAKTTDPAQRAMIGTLPTPGQAKRAGRRVSLRPDWEARKLSIMGVLLRQKFACEPFRGLLLATGSAEIVESNTWGDRFWGVDGNGENHLGLLLMAIRAELRK